jgi:endoglucanase
MGSCDQVGDRTVDHAYWGRPENFPDDMLRPAFPVTSTNKGSDVAAYSAAAMAAASKALAQDAKSFSMLLIGDAVALYNFAKENEGFYSDATDTGGTGGAVPVGE